MQYYVPYLTSLGLIEGFGEYLIILKGTNFNVTVYQSCSALLVPAMNRVSCDHSSTAINRVSVIS